MPDPAQAPLSTITLQAFAWRLLTNASRLVLQVAVQITLARLLPVDAFGLLAITMLVIGLGVNISEMGTAPALIQRPVITPIHVRAGFSLSVITGTVLTAAVWYLAVPAGVLFNTPAVTPVLRLVGFVFVLGSCGTTAEALLQRDMEYRRLLKVEVLSYAAGYVVVGLTLAMLGYGVWALAWATVIQTAVKSAMLLAMSRHPMRPCFAAEESRELLDFGIGMSLSRLAYFAAQNGDYFVVARWLGSSALGLYSRAYGLMTQPIAQFSSILNVVLFPAYSSVQTDFDRLRRGYLGSLSLSAIVVFPVLTLLAIVAPEVLVGVFGPQWAPATRPLQILCVGGAGWCMFGLADSVVRARGAVYSKFVYLSLYAASVFGGAYLGRHSGITGVSVGVLAAFYVAYVLMARLSLRLIECSWRKFFEAQRPGLVVSAGVAAIGVPLAAALRALDWPALAVLASTAVVCGVVWVGAVLSLPRRWLSDTQLSILATARASALALAADVRRRWQPRPV